MYTIPVPETSDQRSRTRLGEAVDPRHPIKKANWETGTLWVTRQRINEEAGFPENTIKRWMQTLVEAGEISTRRVRNWTPVTITDYSAIARTRR